MVRATDQQLLDRLSGDDATAFSQVVNRYADMVYTTCWRILRDEARAAEVVQETFFQLFKSGSRVSGCLGGWLHRVATRRAIDVVRQDASRRKREAAYAAEYDSSSASWAQLEPLVDESMEEVDEDLRELLTLHFLEQKSMVQIAALKGVSQPTISRRIAQGLEEMRRHLRDRGVAVGTVPLQSLLIHGMQFAPEMLVRKLGKMALAQAAAMQGGGMAVGTGMHVGAAAVVAALVGASIWLVVLREGTGVPAAPQSAATPTQPTAAASPPMAQTAASISAGTSAPEALPKAAPAPPAPVTPRPVVWVKTPVKAPAMAKTTPAGTNAPGPVRAEDPAVAGGYWPSPHPSDRYGGRPDRLRNPQPRPPVTELSQQPTRGVFVVNLSPPGASARNGRGSINGPPLMVQGLNPKVPGPGQRPPSSTRKRL